MRGSVLLIMVCLAALSCVSVSPVEESNRLMSIGISLRGAGKFSQAIDYYSKAIELNPKNHLAYYNRAIANDYAGNRKLAI